MKAVLISIQPKWCELIASGEKTVEVRKTRPKLKPPFKVYIYCTKNKDKKIDSWLNLYCDSREVTTDIKLEEPCYQLNGKIIGEFTCQQIHETRWFLSPDHPSWQDRFDEESCLTDRELYEYSKGGTFYGWNISELVIYDEPKELSEFRKPEMPTGLRYENDSIKKPPQSWCYVEEE